MEKQRAKVVFAGIDTHKDTHMLALLDGFCNVIETREFSADALGYAMLEQAIGNKGAIVGIEGCRSYGTGIAEYLTGAGYAVREVIRPKRQQRRRGKTDAIAAAKNVASGDGTTPKELNAILADLRGLIVSRDGFEKSMVQLANRVSSLLVTMPGDIRDLYRGLSGPKLLGALSSSQQDDGALSTCHMLAREWNHLGNLIDELDVRIEAIVRESCPNLLGAAGIGPISAARLMLAAGSNPERLESEAAFSMLCGTSPIPASSGKTNRHRLNRGGDRQANRAIHEIAYARMSFDEKTKTYIEKKISEGKSKKEAIRCLCRFIAREVYRLITSPQDPLPDPRDIAERRKKAGLTQAQVAETLGVSSSKVSQMETGRTIDRTFMHACLEFIDSYLETPCKTY